MPELRTILAEPSDLGLTLPLVGDQVRRRRVRPRECTCWRKHCKTIPLLYGRHRPRVRPRGIWCCGQTCAHPPGARAGIRKLGTGRTAGVER